MTRSLVNGRVSDLKLAVRGASKTFAGQRVLTELSVEVRAGEVHVIVGHNGSGKSTFVKLLAGYHEPDPGSTAEVAKRRFQLGSAAAAEHAGLRFVHQDLALIETLDSVDNVHLGGRFPTRAGGRIDWAGASRETERLLSSLGFEFDVSQPVRALSMTQRTGVAIARALLPRDTPSQVLVLDEPTAALPSQDVGRLFEVIRALQLQGLGIMYISHHLEEVFELGDRITVLCDGVAVATVRPAEIDEAGLVELMVGRSPEHRPQSRPAAARKAETVLKVRDLSAGVLTKFDVDVRRGEVVGVAGIDGSGRPDLALAIFGGTDRSGEVRLSGALIPALRPDVAVRHGVALVPADRAGEAAFAGLSITDNLTLPKISTRLRGLLVADAAQRAEATSWSERLSVRPNRPSAAFATLSGGNQQKVVLARWLRLSPKLLILDEPTKGVDVGAVVSIWDLIRDAAGDGAAVLACSSDAGELAAYCDRVIVLRRGRIAAELSGDELDADRLDALVLSDATDRR
jgi:ribose transport system ATP-binding protein